VQTVSSATIPAERAVTGDSPSADLDTGAAPKITSVTAVFTTACAMVCVLTSKQSHCLLGLVDGVTRDLANSSGTFDEYVRQLPTLGGDLVIALLDGL